MSVAGARKAVGLVGVLALVAVSALILLGSLKFRPVNDAARTVTGWWVGGWGWFGRSLPGWSARTGTYQWVPALIAVSLGLGVGLLLRRYSRSAVVAGLVAGLVALFLYVPMAGVRLADLTVWMGHQFDQFRAGML